MAEPMTETVIDWSASAKICPPTTIGIVGAVRIVDYLLGPGEVATADKTTADVARDVREVSEYPGFCPVTVTFKKRPASSAVGTYVFPVAFKMFT
jgi:hypothetical protein